MYILGINISHHASSCLLLNGEIIYYIEEERLSRKKNHLISRDCSIDSPIRGAEYVKKYTKYIDYVIFSSPGSENFDLEKQIINNLIINFEKNKIKIGEIVYNFSEHHLYHAANAFYASGFDKSGCLILDGSGAYTTKNKNNIPYREIESIYHFSYEKVQKLFKHYSTLSEGFYSDFLIEKSKDCTKVFSDSISCGNLFTEAAVCFGMGHIDQSGKIMGMSSYGDSSNYGEWYSKIDNIFITNNNVITPEFWKKYDSFDEKANLSKKIQEETKNHTIRLIEKTLVLSNSNNIVLSGGYFLNCVNNYEYLKHFPDVNFYIDSIAHDGGTAIGSAKYLWYTLTSSQKISSLNTLYLGL